MSTNDTIKTVDDAFEWFEKNVARVDEQDNKDAKAVHPDIRKAVCEAMPVEHHFLSGSYGRRVQAVKLKDIDVIVVLTDDDGAFGADARGTLLQVQDALRDCDLVRQARPPSVRSVKALLHDYEFHVDIVPAIRPTVGDGLYLTRNLPEEGYNDWTLEYPEQQLKACQDKNKSTNGLYVPATRVVRTWNQRYPTVKPLRSYHADRSCTTASATPRRCRTRRSPSSTTPTRLSPPGSSPPRPALPPAATSTTSSPTRTARPPARRSRRRARGPTPRPRPRTRARRWSPGPRSSATSSRPLRRTPTWSRPRCAPVPPSPSGRASARAIPRREPRPHSRAVVEPLLNPDRPKFRWWTEHWLLIWQLEQHAMALDPHLRRLPLALVDRHPGLRRYVEAWGIPPWDVIGWQTEAEGPWRQRRLVALAPRPPWQADPKVLCLDDPTDSLHRNGPLELCLYYERDPDERRWKVNDGLVRLFDLARAHVWSEHIWRRRGRKASDWPTPQAVHGYGAPVRANPGLALPPVLQLTADGHPAGVPLA